MGGRPAMPAGHICFVEGPRAPYGSGRGAPDGAPEKTKCGRPARPAWRAGPPYNILDHILYIIYDIIYKILYVSYLMAYFSRFITRLFNENGSNDLLNR